VNAECIKLISYFGERNRVNGTFVADALIDLYGRHDISASIVLRGIQGFGLKHHLRTDSSLSLSEDLPLTAIAVGTRPDIEGVLNQTFELNRGGLVTLERAAAQREGRARRHRGECRRGHQADSLFRPPR
jgi:PII-like signaling protein